MTNHESPGGGCVLWFLGTIAGLALLAYLAGSTNLPGVVLGWIL